MEEMHLYYAVGPHGLDVLPVGSLPEDGSLYLLAQRIACLSLTDALPITALFLEPVQSGRKLGKN
jgi:hypothetical protein